MVSRTETKVEIRCRDLRGGLDICCLGALRDDLMPGQWVKTVDNDTLWGALSSCNAENNPLSLLGALDIALYRQGDSRFLEFAAAAVSKLADDRFEQAGGTDIYTALHIVYDFVRQPGYWKRMCAWMQAGLIIRSLAMSRLECDTDSLRQWGHSGMPTAGAYAVLVDAVQEPMLLVQQILPQTLRNQMLGRLRILRLPHESKGHQVPQSEDIDHALAQAQDRKGLPWTLLVPLKVIDDQRNPPPKRSLRNLAIHGRTALSHSLCSSS